MLTRLASFIESVRLQHHFKRVEQILLTNDTSVLSPQALIVRQQHIQSLREYRDNGIFPRNYSPRPFSPCFIDREGRVCAVGHLLMTSGQAELAQKISVVDNYARVKNMQFPELQTWAHESGLTVDELKTIQPGYPGYLVMSILTSPLTILWLLLGPASSICNFLYIRTRNPKLRQPILGMLSTVFAFVELFWLWSGSQPDGVMPRDYFNMVIILLLLLCTCGVISLTAAIAALVYKSESESTA